MHAHKLQTITVYKAILFVGYKLYFNLYGMFPIKSNDITFTAHIVSKILNNNNNNNISVTWTKFNSAVEYIYSKYK